MEKEKIKKIANSEIKKIIEDDDFDKIIKSLIYRNKNKISFVPLRFQVVSGFLQSLNIKFIKFIESFIAEIIRLEQKFLVSELTQKEIFVFTSVREDKKITEYMSKIKAKSKNNSGEFSQKDFKSLIKLPYLDHEKLKEKEKIQIDLLISDLKKEHYFYFEIKGNDDHDSGKFENINRKLFHNYFGLRRYFIKNDIHFKSITPKIIYFNSVKKKDNNFLGEKINIYRGEEFWNKYTNTDFNELYDVIRDVQTNLETVKYFENIVNKVMTFIEFFEIPKD